MATFPEHTQHKSSVKPTTLTHKASAFLADGFLYCSGAMVALLLVWILWSFITPGPTVNPSSTFHPLLTTTGQSNEKDDDSKASAPLNCAAGAQGSCVNLRCDPPDGTFYDDPEFSYSIEKPVKNWDEKRRAWMELHPSFAAGAPERVLILTGSQPSACRNPIGDHLLLRFFKNKVDYARIHGYDIFYNNALLHPKMFSFWAKLPVVRAAMLAHPETEWIWWVDSDALFTDMEFILPLDRYKKHDLIVHGWTHLVYDAKSWTGLNAGVFLIRNCQWSMDLIDMWARMGPQTPDYDEWGKILRSIFKDKIFPESDDQTGLIYLLVKEKEKWADKIYLEGEYYFEGYWEEIVGTLDNITEGYAEIERRARQLRRRHAEMVSEQYGAFREEYLVGMGTGRESMRRPFITHFTGCQPCSGDHNQMYSGESCWDGMRRALNFADNQVLRKYGFVHPDLLDQFVSPVEYDYLSS